MKSLIKRFEIHGVHGYKNLKLEFNGQTTIVVAENGTGKTTLLSTLYYVLTGKTNNLTTLEFKWIYIEFFDGQEFKIEKSELNYALTPELSKLSKISRGYYSEYEVFEFICTNEIKEIIDSTMFHRLNMRTSESTDALIRLILSIKNSINISEQGGSSGIQALGLISKKIEGVEVVYLPTYRRVEKIFTKAIEDEKEFRHLPRARKEARVYDQISYGLSDVGKTLRYMSEEIERKSNLGYRNLSTTMLEDLLKGKASRQNKTIGPLPNIDDLSRFLGRVETQNNHNKDAIIDDIADQIDTGGIEKNPYLRYFLSKLQDVISGTKELESMIEGFVSICNEYLKRSSDSKYLKFDAASLSVLVFDDFTGGKIKLDDLSSGEKQIISLMSALYLDKKEKLILIDEPELSLSIEWQKKILPDVINSGTVSQILAITHSPFIFDNELDSLARVLIVEKVRNDE